MTSQTNCNVGMMKFKNPTSPIIVTTITSAARTGGGCHSKPNPSKTGLSANLKNAREDPLKAPLLQYGARSAKRLDFHSAENAMNPETRPKRRRSVSPSGKDTPNNGFTIAQND